MKEKSGNRPPKVPRQFLRWILRPDFVEEIEGDLHETFGEWVARYGRTKASWFYILHTFSIIRPSLVKKKVPMDLTYQLSLIRNYLVTGWRNFRKYKRYSITNLIGLTVGFATSLLLLMIVKYERSFDRFHNSSEDIYRVATQQKEGGISDLIVTPQVPLMVTHYPEIIAGTRFKEAEDIFEVESRSVRSRFHYVDSQFTKVFDFTVLFGDLEQSLVTTNSLVITEPLAISLFGRVDVVGELIRLVNDETTFAVGAVLKEPPKNSTLQFRALIPWANTPEWFSEERAGNWYNTFMTGYVRLHPSTGQGEVEDKLVAFKNRYFLEERRATSDIILLPLEEEHFRDSSKKKVLYILMIVAVAILIISCINFINLSMAQLAQRTREMGVRKVLGSRPRDLVFQFVCENLILCTSALVIGLLACYLMIPVVSSYFDYSIEWFTFSNAGILLYWIALSFFIVVLSVWWPAFALTTNKSTSLLHSDLSWDKSGGLLRKGLMVAQFCLSIALVISTAFIWRQINYMQNKDLHFNGSQVATADFYSELFRVSENMADKIKDLKFRLKSNSAIENVTVCNSVPGSYPENYNTFSAVDSTEIRKASLRQLSVDDDFFTTFDIQLVQGRNFDPERQVDQQVAILNEQAMKAFGWKNIDQKFVESGGGGTKYQIIGVVKDYHYRSLKDEVQPLIHFYHPESQGAIAVRIAPDQVETGLRAFEREYNLLDPYESFSYSFVDEDFANLYFEQKRLGTTATFFCGIAIFLACLGLFSLAAYSIRLRRKEIGVRRVLGASTFSIILLLVKRFGILLLVGFIIACPLVYLAMLRFLSDYAHHIPIGPLMFLGGGGMVILLAITMIGLQSRYAALENPTINLRDE